MEAHQLDLFPLPALGSLWYSEESGKLYSIDAVTADTCTVRPVNVPWILSWEEECNRFGWKEFLTETGAVLQPDYNPITPALIADLLTDDDLTVRQRGALAIGSIHPAYFDAAREVRFAFATLTDWISRQGEIVKLNGAADFMRRIDEKTARLMSGYRFLTGRDYGACEE